MGVGPSCGVLRDIYKHGAQPRLSQVCVVAGHSLSGGALTGLLPPLESVQAAAPLTIAPHMPSRSPHGPQAEARLDPSQVSLCAHGDTSLSSHVITHPLISTYCSDCTHMYGRPLLRKQLREALTRKKIYPWCPDSMCNGALQSYAWIAYTV